MFIEGLFTVAKTWRQCKCLMNRYDGSDKEHVRDIYIYNRVIDSRKKHEAMPAWINQEIVM